MKPITYLYEIFPHLHNGIVTYPNGELVEYQNSKREKENYKAIINGDVTVIILEDGSKGIAKRNPSDRYNVQVGFDIAYKRAKIKSLQKEIQEISKSQYVKSRRIY